MDGTKERRRKEERREGGEREVNEVEGQSIRFAFVRGGRERVEET